MLTCGQVQAENPAKTASLVQMHHNGGLEEEVVSASEVHEWTEILLKTMNPESPNDKLVDADSNL